MNSRHLYQKGAHVQWQGHLGEIVEASADEPAVHVRLNEVSGVQLIPVNELTPIQLSGTSLAKLPLASVNPQKWTKAERRAGACRAIMTNPLGVSVAVVQAAKELGVKERTVWRILDRFRSTPKVSALVDEKPGPHPDSRLLPLPIEVVVQEALEEMYLTRERPTATVAIEYAERICRERGLTPPCADTIRRRIRSLVPEYVARHRDGRKKACEKFEPVPEHLSVESPLQLVQIDHTLADVILVSDDEARTVVGRPWLTLAIDVATRCIVGFHVTFDAPSSVSVAVCVLSILVPKSQLLRAMGLERHEIEWPCSGKPEGFLTDNAKDFHADALKRGCAEHGIDLHFRPVGKPRWGGVIERLVGTFMGRLRMLPGATQRDVRARGDHDVEAASCMTLAAFRQWLTLEITTQYHQKPHRTIGMPPMDAWHRMSASDAMAAARVSEQECLRFFVDFLPYKMKPIRRIGIELHGLTYWTQSLRRCVADGNKYAVRYDPRDITRVFVVNENGQVIIVPTIRDVPAISVNEWRTVRRRDRALGTTETRLAIRDQGARAMQEIVATNTKEQRIARRAEQKRLERRKSVLDVPGITHQENTTSSIRAPILDFSRAPTPYGVLGAR